MGWTHRSGSLAIKSIRDHRFDTIDLWILCLKPGFATLPPRFFVRNREGRDEFRVAYRYSPLTEPALLRGTRLVPAAIRHR